MENICTRDVQTKRRASISGTLVAMIPLAVSANDISTSILDNHGHDNVVGMPM